MTFTIKSVVLKRDQACHHISFETHQNENGSMLWAPVVTEISNEPKTLFNSECPNDKASTKYHCWFLRKVTSNMLHMKYHNKSTANATEYDRHDKTIILCPKRGMTDSKFDKIPGKTNLVCDT